MPRTGDNIYKRKDGRWEGRFVKGRRNGHTIFGSVFGKTRRETKVKLATAQYEWNEGLLEAKRNRTKLGCISDAWLRESEAFLKESTVAKYRDYLRCYICPKFGKTDMAEIGDEVLSAFCVNLLEHGGSKSQGLSTKTVSEIFRVMKQLRKFAMLRKIVVGYTAECLGIKQKNKPLRVFSPSEREKLHTYLDGSQDRKHLGILLCLSTGLRLGELCALTWDDISLEEQKLYVRRTLQRIRNCYVVTFVKPQFCGIFTRGHLERTIEQFPAMSSLLYADWIPQWNGFAVSATIYWRESQSVSA